MPNAGAVPFWRPTAIFPGGRLVACLNPRLREERARKREDLLQATEASLRRIAEIVRRKGSKLRGVGKINRRVGREANRRKVEKHFDITVRDDDLTFKRNAGKIADEARLDGVHIVRTSLDADALDAHGAVQACKSLSRVERAFRHLKTARLQVRPVCVHSPERVRAHVFLWRLGPPRGVASAAAAGADAVRGRRPRRRRRPVRLTRPAGPNLRTGAPKKRRADHRRRPARAQPAEPAGRSGHAHAEHRASAGQPRKTTSPWPPNQPRCSDAPSNCSTSPQQKCSQRASRPIDDKPLKPLHYPPNRCVKFRLGSPSVAVASVGIVNSPNCWLVLRSR